MLSDKSSLKVLKVHFAVPVFISRGLVKRSSTHEAVGKRNSLVRQTATVLLFIGNDVDRSHSTIRTIDSKRFSS